MDIMILLDKYILLPWKIFVYKMGVDALGWQSKNAKSSAVIINLQKPGLS